MMLLSAAALLAVVPFVLANPPVGAASSTSASRSSSNDSGAVSGVQASAQSSSNPQQPGQALDLPFADVFARVSRTLGALPGAIRALSAGKDRYQAARSHYATLGKELSK